MDVVNSKKICKTCGEEIVAGQAYWAIADDFEIGKGDAVDLLTKSYTWSTHHNTTGPSRVPVVCIPKEENDGKTEN